MVKTLLRKKRILGIILFGILFSLFLYLISHPGKNLLKDISLSKAFYDREGNLLRLTLSSDDKYRLPVSVSELTPIMKQVILLQEDKYYYKHFGVNPISIIRAINETYIKKTRVIGASTITMQLARLLYKIDTHNIIGKLKQIQKALFLEVYFSKEEILNAYLTLMPCGKNLEGFSAASLFYYGKSLNQLTLLEIMLICVIPQNPNDRTPELLKINSNLFEARARLFDRWIKLHPEDELYRKYLDFPLSLVCSLPFKAPHLLDDLLKQNIKESRIVTSLNPEIQKLTKKHLELYVNRMSIKGVKNGSVIVLDYKTMELLAAVGSVEYFNNTIEGQVNGTTSKRSPGSTLKPFIYALAIDQGIIHSKSMLKDSPTSFGEYTPDNYLSDFQGPVLATEALISSRNIPAIRLANKLSNPDLYDFLKLSGLKLKSREHYGLSIVLGSAEVSMENLVSLYAILANKGRYQSIKKTINISLKNPEVKSMLSPESSFMVLDMLLKNPKPDSILNKDIAENISMAYKTGTSIGFKDCWSIGIIDNMVLGVWIGNFNGQGNNAFLGRYMASPLLFEIAKSLKENHLTVDNSDLYIPNDLNIVETEVCSLSGAIPNDYCLNKIFTYFIPGRSPIKKCSVHREIFINSENGFRSKDKSSKTLSEVWEFWPSDLLKLFKEAGIPRRMPPPFSSDFFDLADSSTGFTPVIDSPLENVEYIIQADSSLNELISLKAICDGDISEVFWFVNGAYLGRVPPDEILFWEPVPGKAEIKVLDEKGRFSYRTINIVNAH